MKTKKRAKVKKGNKKEIILKAKPKNVWNSIRKLENYLKKAGIQANIFMESLNELRDLLSFEIRAALVKNLCNSVNGDLLSAVWKHKKRLEEQGTGEGNREADVILLGVFSAFENVLNITPYKSEGDKISITRDSSKDYDFDVHPDALDDESIQEFEAEVLRGGWKIENRVIIKPKVFEIRK